MFIDFTLNISIIIAYLFVIGLLSKEIYKGETYQSIFQRIDTQLIAGVLLGVLGIILMMFSIQVHPTVIADLRHIATVLAAMLFGAPAALVSAFIIGVSRVLFFEGISEVSLTAMVLMFFIGIACALLTKLPVKPLTKFVTMNLVGITITYLALFINLVVYNNDYKSLFEIYEVSWIYSLLGGFIAFYVAHYIFTSNKNYYEVQRTIQQLEHTNDQLEEIKKQLVYREQQYKSLFEHNQSATFTLDFQGHFQEINHSAEVMTGYDKNDLKGSSFIPLISKKYVEDTFHNFDRVKQGESVTFETEIIHRDGSVVKLNANTAPIIIDNRIIGVIGVAHDITKQKEAEKRIMESESQYRSLIQLSPEVIFVLRGTRVVFINDKALDFFGVNKKEDLIGKSIFEFLHPEDREYVAYSVANVFETYQETKVHHDIRLIRENGGIVFANVGTKLIDYNGSKAIMGVIHDDTEQKQVEEELRSANQMLQELSQLDGLTGIPNRRYYNDMLANEWSDALKKGKSMSLIMIDIDHFKLYNDTYGHLEGDTCLKTVAQSIKSSVNRPRDFVARYGGEEFSVILPETNLASGRAMGEKIRANVELLAIPHESSLVKSVVTVSVGVATMTPNKSIEPKDLIEMADQSLYVAKEHGRNQVGVIEEMVNK